MSSVSIPLALLLTALPPGGESAAPANDSIRQRDLKADLWFLAGDSFRGRLTGTPENDLASEFIAARFERLGLKPLGTGGSYFQRFHLVRAALGASNALEVERDGVTLRFGPRAGFVPQLFSPSAEARGKPVFVGFGISAPQLGHDDYDGVDVRGKVVLALDHEPGEDDPDSPFDGVVSSEAGNPLRKALTAQEKGAVGILFVADVHNHRGVENFAATARVAWPDQPPRIARYLLQDWVERVRIPAAVISTAAARALVGGSGRSLEDLADRSEKPGDGPAPALDGVTVRLAVEVRHEVVPDRNVLAAVEGSDRERKGEWVVIACHHDHDGADGVRVLNGADDNASGTVGMLEIAEAYALAAEAGHRPKRSVLFAAFNSEERGLLGSWAFVERPPVPLGRIVAVLNMDMIGRDEEVPEGGGRRFRGLPVQTAESNRDAVNLLGWSRSASLAEVVDRANASIGLRIKKVLDNNVSNLLRRSDQWPFLQAGVPAVFFHTGLHPDYHTADDRPEKIRYAKMERIVRLVHQASWDLAQQPGRPRLDRGAPAARGSGS
jgi:hypothetical protein